MTLRITVALICGMAFALALAALFSLYRNPILEMYLASWAFC